MVALTGAVPASAQGVGDILRQGVESLLGGSAGSTTDLRLNELNTRIQGAYQRGEISQSVAVGLQDELRGVARQEQAYRSGGLTRTERNDLEQRLQAVESRIQRASYDGNRDRYDRDGGYDRDGRYDRDDRNDRDDRWSNNDRRDRCPPGLERKNNGCLPPGQAMKQGDRYNNQYDRVPARYGERYADTNRYLYRYNDGRIYQVDRRSDRIVRVTSVRR
jgi:hypothetical protein